jgi:hypothetical protein
MQSTSLDRTFRALAAGTRRSMIHALAGGHARSASDLGRRFDTAQPTITCPPNGRVAEGGRQVTCRETVRFR